MHAKSLQSCQTLCDPMGPNIAKVPLCIGFSRQEYWSGFPCPPPEDLPNPGIESRSPALQSDSCPSEPPGKPLVSYSGQKKCPTWTKWLSSISSSQLGIIFGSFWKRFTVG